MTTDTSTRVAIDVEALAIHVRGERGAPARSRFDPDRLTRRTASRNLRAVAGDAMHRHAGGAGLPATSELETLGAPVVLRDGSRIRIRQGRPADRDLLLRGFERLSATTRYKRFLVAMPHLAESMVDYLLDVDHHNHEAMIALDDATGEGIGVARYVRNPERREAAELAITVVDDWQGKGVGTLLLDVISARAREEHIEVFTTLILGTNDDMIAMIGALGPTRVVDRDRGTIELETAIPPVGLSAALHKLLKIAAREDIAAPLADRLPNAPPPPAGGGGA